MRPMQSLSSAGMVVQWDDWFTIPARDWDDWVLWKEAEAERTRRANNEA